MNFWKSFFAAFLALVIFTFVGILLLLGWIGSIASEEQVVIKENSVLHLDLDAQITELQQENPFAGLPVPGGDVNHVGLLQLKQAIEHAKNNNNIKGIYLQVRYPLTGFSSLEEIRESLIDFRKSGKWVVAYNEVMSEGAYYLATAADKIYLNPEGDIEFNGLTIEISFFKRLFDKLEIKPQIFRVGEFKSAVEPFMLEKMSDENRLQLTELANSIYDYSLTRMAEARSIPRERLEELSDKMMVRNAALAKEYGLVDELYYIDQFHADLRKRLSIDDKADINFVKYGKYRKSFSTYKNSKNEIAVIVAEGTIMPGEADQQNQVIGAETFVEEIRKAREDDDIKAIVLRINSPGGEFRSSDMMWREIQLTKKVKPIIASMSDYAASGGYYLAMGCDTIVAQPHTITGSIGIFGMMFDMSDFLGNKLGITFDEVKTGDFGEMYTVSRPLTPAEREYWQKNLNEHYETFTTKAAEGRGLPVAEIQKVASGRVWTGAQALSHKLIDVQGGFNDAVTIAATKAGVQDDYKVKFYPRQKTFLEQWLSRMEDNTRTETIRTELGEYYPWYQQLQRIKTFHGAQARMPFEFKIQ
jgi:protease-4